MLQKLETLLLIPSHQPDQVIQDGSSIESGRVESRAHVRSRHNSPEPECHRLKHGVFTECDIWAIAVAFRST